MAVSEAQFQQPMESMKAQIQGLYRALNVRIALAESKVLRLRSIREDGAKHVKSGTMDSRKIYPQSLKDVAKWRPWSERVLRWARMQSSELHATLSAAIEVVGRADQPRLQRGVRLLLGAPQRLEGRVRSGRHCQARARRRRCGGLQAAQLSLRPHDRADKRPTA